MLRRARWVVVFWVVASLVGVTSGAGHLMVGDLMRTAYTSLLFIPNTFAIYLLHRTGRVEPAVHFLCACLTGVIVVSPLLSVQAVPVLVGLFPLPVAATIGGGPRVGMIWTGLISLVLAVSAFAFSLEAAEFYLTWNVLVVTAATGLSLVMVERSRDRLVDELIEAREDAERHAAERERAERERAEEAFRESQAYFLESFRRAPSILVLAERETGEILDVNDRFTQLTGYSREAAIGRTSLDLGIWKEARDRRFVRSEVAGGRSIEDSEFPIVTRDGETRWILVSIEPLEIRGRACTLLQGVDITERKEQDAALESRRRELEDGFEQRGLQLRASQQKRRESERLAAVGTLAAGIAHQVNNPAGAIALAAESTLLELDDPSPAEARLDRARQALELALDEARRCGRIVKGLLKFAREEKAPQWVEDLDETIHRACTSARTYVEVKGGSLVFEPSPLALRVLMSPIDIEQATINLLHNAVESRSSGVRVVVETRAVDDWAEIVVTDDGVGIPEEERSRVLDPFYTTRLDEGGSGLGLSVVHGVAKDHRGNVSIESAPGGGTRFRIRIPLVKQGRC